MICVFSYCESDKAMAFQLARHINCLGSVKEHSCILIHPEGVDFYDIEEQLRPVFGSYRRVTYKETLKGWPDGPNQCYAVAAKTVFDMPGSDPWLWLEADCVPTRPEWLTQIEREHRYCGLPILGAFESTFGLDGKVIGRHVTGVAVYPHDWWKTCAPLRSLETATDGYRRTGSSPPAFDVYIAPYAVPACATGKTMRHYWKSHSYREIDGEVVCEFTTPYGASNKIDMNAALIHGCKDYSLLDIVQARLTEGVQVR